MDEFASWWWRVLRRRWWAGGALFTAVLGLAAAMLMLTRPVHRAESKLRLGEPPPMGGVSPTSGFVGMFRLGGDPFANDLELLSSRTLAEGVVDDVALNVLLAAPRGWPRDSLVTEIVTSRATIKARFDVEWLDDDVIIVRPRGAEGVALRAAPGEPVRLAVPHDASALPGADDVPAAHADSGVRMVFREWRRGMPRRITVRTIPHAEATRLTSGRIQVDRTRRDANVVRIRYQAADAAVAHAAVASAIDRFISLRTSIQRRESGETIDSLRTIAEQTRAELAQAEQALERAHQGTGLVVAEAQAEGVVTQYAEASTQLEQARMELAALDAALESAGEAATQPEAWSALLAFPRFMTNETFSDLTLQLTEREQARRQLARVRTLDNLEHRMVIEQVQYLDESLRGLAREYRSTIALQLTGFERLVQQLGAQLSGMPAGAIELARRAREARVLAEVVTLTEQRLRQEQLRQALTFANVQVIDPPALRDRPVWPRRKLGLAVAMLLAGATALAGMAIIERADATVRNVIDVRVAVGAPVLAVLRRDGRRLRPLSAAEVSALVRRADIVEAGRARLVLAAAGYPDLGRAAAEAVEAGALAAPKPSDWTSWPDESSSTVAVVGVARPDVNVLGPIDSFANAVVAAAERAPVVLVARAGSTRRAALARAATLLAEAGAAVAGVILVCDRARDAADVWS